MDVRACVCFVRGQGTVAAKGRKNTKERHEINALPFRGGRIGIWAAHCVGAGAPDTHRDRTHSRWKQTNAINCSARVREGEQGDGGGERGPTTHRSGEVAAHGNKMLR